MKPDVDWNAETLRPGCWRLAGEGDNTRRMTVEWMPPQIVDGAATDAPILEFEGRKRLKTSD